MPISINPIFPVIAAQAAAPELALQPGTVIDAQVQKVLANDLVRIAIANLPIEVLSEVPLQVGQTLQLAVSQTSDGIKLAVVGQGSAAAGKNVLGAADENQNAAQAASPRAPAVMPGGAIKPSTDAVLAKHPLTPLQALAVSDAAQAAATRQGSLAPLFANLEAVVSNGVPSQLQQAASQVMALRPRLDQNLGARDLEAAFQKSGLFLESSLASGRLGPIGTLDLKAALLVLRQTLQALGETAVPDNGAAVIIPQAQSRVPATGPAELMSTDHAAAPSIIGSPAIAPSLTPDIEADEILLPQARLPVADDFSKSGAIDEVRWMPKPSPSAAMRAVPADAILNLQKGVAWLTQRTGLPTTRDEEASVGMSISSAIKNASETEETLPVRSNVPPPPFRGALPSAQPVTAPSLPPEASLATIVHRLSDETDAAIARVTLLQVASLPDRADVAVSRSDPPTPRWNFEIPFATPSGTAIAQFEISRDDSRIPLEAAARVWQARFSLDVEPGGPVHALISWSNEKTSVRMWAERSGTAAKLRAGMLHLTEALSRAQLQPGDIVIRHGAPAQSAAAPAGHFLDRAL